MINLTNFIKTKHHVFGISKKRIIFNYFKNIFLNTNIKNPKIKDDYDFKISKDFKLFFKKGDFIVSTRNGLYQVSNFKKKKIFNTKLGYFGIDKFKDYFYIAYYGNGHSKGCIYKFQKFQKFIKFDKIVYKKKFQYFHEIYIKGKNFFVIDSSWITPHENLINFKIDKKGDLIKNKIYNIKKFIPKNLDHLCHLNTINIKKNFIYLLFHNLSQYTNLNSQIIKLKFIKDNLKFISIYKNFDKFNLASAHNLDLKNDIILNSGKSKLIINNKIIKFNNLFLKGLRITKKFFIIGGNSNYHNKKSSINNNLLIFIDKKNHKITKKLKFENNINCILEL